MCFLCAQSSGIGDKVDINYITLNLIEYFMVVGGGLFCPFCPRGQGGGYVEYPRLSTRGGEGVKIGSKLVHVVVECPLIVRSGSGPTNLMLNVDLFIYLGFLINMTLVLENHFRMPRQKSGMILVMKGF